MNVKDMIKENKVYVILLCIVIFIIILFNIFERINSSGDNYKNLNLSKQKNINKMEIKNHLMNDPHFIKILNIEEYDGDIKSNLTMLIKNMLSIIDYTQLEETNENEKHLLNDGYADYKLSLDKFYLAFNELYNYDIENISFSNYPELSNFMLILKNEVIFTTEDLIPNDNLILLGIKKLEENKKIITGDIFVYELYTNDIDVENKVIDTLTKNIKNNVYEDQELFEEYNIKSTKKRILFKEIPKGKYFKYQLLSINHL